MKKLQFRIIGFLVVSALFGINSFGNTVSFDTSFNGTGYSIQAAAPPPQWSLGSSFAIQPDGKIVIGGFTHLDGDHDKFAVMRLNSDGTLDTSFGTGGSVVTPVGTDVSAGQISIQPDGKILLCGHAWMGDAAAYDFTILRYTSAGVLDTSFNGTGVVTRTFNGSSYDYAADLALQPDGKIVMVGSTAVGFEQQDIVLMRFNPDGSLDSAFNGTGILTVADPTLSETAGSVMILSDGKILISGSKNDGVKDNFLLMRFNSNGTTDTSFGTGGTTITSVSSGSNGISSIDLQSDGKIVAGGSSYMARYSANGILDTSFGNSGVAAVQAPGEMNDIRVAGGDKILVSIRFGANAGVRRYMPNGVLDTNFNGGEANLFTPGYSCAAYSVSVQSDNKIVLGGYCSQNGNGIPKFAAWRVQETRTKRLLDFNGDGLTDMSIFRPSTGQWWYQDSYFASQTFAGQWGLSTDRPVPADYTGDGRTDVAVFRPSSGEWYILRSENGSFYSFTFGTSGDIPIAADFDGDDKADYGVFRPSTNEWYIQKSTGGLLTATFGTSGDKPVPSDYDGDFKTDIAIYRPSTGEWWINRSSDASIYGFQFGTSSDSPVQGDYTGDNKTDAAVFRPSTGEWFILPSEGGSFFGLHFGTNGDLPTPGNYGGDGRFDFVVYRPSENRWYFQLTGGGPYFASYFGTTGDQPLPNLFVP
jgi:uncharacterized delta-60 repeat protein